MECFLYCLYSGIDGVNEGSAARPVLLLEEVLKDHPSNVLSLATATQDITEHTEPPHGCQRQSCVCWEPQYLCLDGILPPQCEGWAIRFGWTKTTFMAPVS